MLITMKEMMAELKPGKGALGAFHAMNLEQVQGILEAAVEERSPVIIAVDEPVAMYTGLGAFMALIRELASDVPVPVSVLLDHVHDLELISQALDKGYSAVLADFRGKEAQEAIDNLVKIKEMCQKTNAALEVEVKDPAFSQDEIIGFVGSILGDAAPDSFCVSLAQEDRERPSQQVFNLIKDISSATDVLVSLAGAGRWPEEDIRKAIGLGVWKISVGTRINMAFTYGLRTYLDDNPGKIQPRSYLGFARDYLRSETINCIKSFKS